MSDRETFALMAQAYGQAPAAGPSAELGFSAWWADHSQSLTDDMAEAGLTTILTRAACRSAFMAGMRVGDVAGPGSSLSRLEVLATRTIAAALQVHPALLAGEDDDAPTCRVCACTDEQACAGGCRWVEDPQQIGDLCSSCRPLVLAIQAGVRAELWPLLRALWGEQCNPGALAEALSELLAEWYGEDGEDGDVR